MDRLIKMEPSNQVVVRIEPDRPCTGWLSIRNVMYTMPVAFRLLPMNMNRFAVRPKTAIIAPQATLTVEIRYLPPTPPYPLLPENAPESDDVFFLDSVVSPTATFTDGASATSFNAVPYDWFTAKKKQVFTDTTLSFFYVGSPVLCRLVDAGDLNRLRQVLERSDPVWHAADSVDSLGRTLLHLAISRFRPDLVQILLEFGADVDTPDWHGMTPLEAATATGVAPVVELLLARGASTKRSSAWGPLHHASARGQVKILRFLLDKGAAVDETAADGRTALHLATEESRQECAALLLAAGARADVRGGAAGNTPLHVVAASGDEETARLLITSGCAGLTEMRNSVGKTAYDVAVQEGQRRLFDLLREGEKLAAAVRCGEVKEVEKAVEMGAAVDGKDGYGWTGLMRAAFKGEVDVMRFLLNKGAAVDARDDEGYTALHCAVEAGQAEAVQLLLKQGADVVAMTSRGRTAVEIATSHGYAGIVRILEQDCTPTMQLPEPVDPFPLPAKNGRIGAVREKKEGKTKGDIYINDSLCNRRLRLKSVLKNGDFET